jgi:DNA topoisomerase III
VESLEAKQHRLSAPQLYDLTELQRHANRLFGWSAKRTLDLAQGLYERAKLLSYPRTDCRHLSRSVAQTLPAIVRVIAGPYRDKLAPGTGERALGPRFVDDAKVSDHHAILPTTTAPAGVSLSEDERRLYDLVCRRLLSAWHEDHLYSVTTVISAIAANGQIDRYRTSGTRVDRPGWRVLDPPPPSARRGAAVAESDAGAGGTLLPPGLATGEALDVLDARSVAKKTRPPRRLTEAALLTAMETAGRTLEDRELSEAMRDTGLGTPATRAAIIETLLDRGYLEREGKSLRATDKGIALIETVHPEVKSPIMTGKWESELQGIQRGTASLDGFLRGIEGYVRDVVQRVRSERRPGATRARASESPRAAAAHAAEAPRQRGRPAHATRSDDARRPAASGAARPPRSPAAAAPAVPSWMQWNGAWHVRGPAGLAGTSVRVQRRDGSTAQVQLGEIAQERPAFTIYRVARSGAPASSPRRAVAPTTAAPAAPTARSSPAARVRTPAGPAAPSDP